MSPIEETLRRTLGDYLEAARRADDPSVDLRSHFTKIELLAKSLPPSAHPQLRHYLQSKSYRKAFDWLGGAPSDTQ
ncbi:MAG: hypothetical protein JO317_02390 [Verrucomicrobiae bacterium]|nr:hypothetical protein [Verrucomicrobiae bacterium]